MLIRLDDRMVIMMMMLKKKKKNMMMMMLKSDGGVGASDDDDDDDDVVVDDGDDDDSDDDGGDVDLGCVSLLKSKIMQIKNPDNLGFSLRKETIYPKRDHSSFISISTVSRRKNNMAADKVASLLIFPSILDG